MKQRARPIGKKLELATYAHDQTVEFVARGGEGAPSVCVPLPIVYRLYHLGRAYNLGRIIGLHPTGSVAIDYINSQTLGLELNQLASLVDDPALHHYISNLQELVAFVRADTKRDIIMRAT